MSDLTPEDRERQIWDMFLWLLHASTLGLSAASVLRIQLGDKLCTFSVGRKRPDLRGARNHFQFENLFCRRGLGVFVGTRGGKARKMVRNAEMEENSYLTRSAVERMG